MAKRIEVDIVINKEPHEIYYFISDLLNLPFWSDVDAVEIVSGGGEIGSIYNIITPTLLTKRKTSVEITKTVTHALFAFKDNSLSVNNETGFELKEEDGKTRVTAYQEIEIGPLVSLLTLNFLTSKDASRSLSGMLERLKSILEN